MSFLVGFDIDKARMQGGELHLTNKVESFKEELYAAELPPSFAASDDAPPFAATEIQRVGIACCHGGTTSR